MRKPRLKISEERAKSYEQGLRVGIAKGLTEGKKEAERLNGHEQLNLEKEALHCARVASYCAMMVIKRHRGW